MRDPVCFSQYFVNKLNVRSFSNILNSTLLKRENYNLFLRNVINNDLLLKETSEQLKDIIFSFQQNIKTHCKNDFRNYFTAHICTPHDLKEVNKTDIFRRITSLLNTIIPPKFYGCNCNSKIFNKCVKLVLFGMNRQYIYLERLIQNWDYTKLPWSSVDTDQSHEVLYNILFWIFKVLVSGIISLNFYVTTCKLQSDENKLLFFWKNQWQRFYDKKLSDLATAKVLNKCEPYSSGKKIKTKYNAQERLKLKTIKKSTPKLYLVLKSNNDFRPIVRYKTETITTSGRYKIKEKLQFLNTLNRKYEKIEKQYSSLHLEWLLRDKPALYFVKTDLSNAFGSINKIKLLRILAELYLEFQKGDKPLYVKKKCAKHYKEILADLRQPLLIRAGSTIFEWREGLVQGYKYSPALSELYYSYLDNIYFKKHMKKESGKLKMFVRIVDDYLYITDSLDDAYLFLGALSNYRNVNYNKTFVNFPHPLIKFSEDITFIGYTYNTKTLEVSRAMSVFTGDLCYKIAFSFAIQNLGKFLENRIGQSGIQISSHMFNFHYNNEQLIWRLVFTTLCLSANKFCTILAILCDERQMFRYLIIYKKRVAVKLCNSIIDTLHLNKPNDFMFKYCINHFHYLSYKALLLCAQSTSKCNILVPYINIELAKTNCIYGKWKEHASKISRSGTKLMPAIRQICRRDDLKKYIKEFNKLPEGFRCYDQKRYFK